MSASYISPEHNHLLLTKLELGKITSKEYEELVSSRKRWHDEFLQIRSPHKYSPPRKETPQYDSRLQNSLRLVNISLNQYFNSTDTDTYKSSPIIETERFIKEEQRPKYHSYLIDLQSENIGLSDLNEMSKSYELVQISRLYEYFMEFHNKKLLNILNGNNFNERLLKILQDSNSIEELLNKLYNVIYNKRVSSLSKINRSPSLTTRSHGQPEYEEMMIDHHQTDYPQEKYPIFYKKDTGGAGDCFYYAVNAALLEFNKNLAQSENHKLYDLLMNLGNKEKGVGRNKDLRNLVSEEFLSYESPLVGDYNTYKQNKGNISNQKMHWLSHSFIPIEQNIIIKAKNQQEEAAKIIKTTNRYATEIDVILLSELANINILIINGLATRIAQSIDLSDPSSPKRIPGQFISYITPYKHRDRPTKDTIILVNLQNNHYQLGSVFAGEELLSALGKSSTQDVPLKLQNFIRTFSGVVASGINKRPSTRKRRLKGKRGNTRKRRLKGKRGNTRKRRLKGKRGNTRKRQRKRQKTHK